MTRIRDHKKGRKPYKMTDEERTKRSIQVKEQWKIRHSIREEYTRKQNYELCVLGMQTNK